MGSESNGHPPKPTKAEMCLALAIAQALRPSFELLEKKFESGFENISRKIDELSEIVLRSK